MDQQVYLKPIRVTAEEDLKKYSSIFQELLGPDQYRYEIGSDEKTGERCHRCIVGCSSPARYRETVDKIRSKWSYLNASPFGESVLNAYSMSYDKGPQEVSSVF